MQRNRLLGAVPLFTLQLVSGVDAADLAPLSSTELHKRCLAYIDAPQSEEARACGAYVRGFIEGSSRVVLYAESTDGKQRESFSERALRTRLGARSVPDPDYCVNSAMSLREFITQMLAHAEINPPTDEVSASALLYGTLSQFHRC